VSAEGSSLGRSFRATTAKPTLDHEQIVVQDVHIVKLALEKFGSHPERVFSDCLILEAACAAGRVPLATFDRRLAKLNGSQKL